MSKASELFNSLPIEIRKQVIPSTIETQINQIRIDQEKVLRAYQKYMRETNDHVNNLELLLEKALKELEEHTNA